MFSFLLLLLLLLLLLMLLCCCCFCSCSCSCSFLASCFFLLASFSCFLLLASCFLLLASSFLLLVSCFLLLASCFLLLLRLAVCFLLLPSPFALVVCVWRSTLGKIVYSLVHLAKHFLDKNLPWVLLRKKIKLQIFLSRKSLLLINAEKCKQLWQTKVCRLCWIILKGRFRMDWIKIIFWHQVIFLRQPKHSWADLSVRAFRSLKLLPPPCAVLLGNSLLLFFFSIMRKTPSSGNAVHLWCLRFRPCGRMVVTGGHW